MPWELTGNSITANGGFLGTIDAQPLSIRTSNSERMRVSATGELLIATTTSVPGTRLRVAGAGATSHTLAIGTAAPGIDYPGEVWRELRGRLARLARTGPLTIPRVRHELRTSRRYAEAVLDAERRERERRGR